MLIYVLLFPTILNTILLIVMAVVLYRLLGVADQLSARLGRFMERGEEELFATTSSVRHVATQAGNLLEKIVEVVDKYMFALAMRQSPKGAQRTSSVISGLTVGFNILKFLMQYFKKDEEKAE